MLEGDGPTLLRSRSGVRDLRRGRVRSSADCGAIARAPRLRRYSWHHETHAARKQARRLARPQSRIRRAP